MEETPMVGPPRREVRLPREMGMTGSAATSGSAPVTTSLVARPGQRRPARLVGRSWRLLRLPRQPLWPSWSSE